MKMEMVVCILIIILILVTNIVTQKYTKECTAGISERLDVLKEKVLAEKDNQEIDGEVILREIINIENKWNEYQEKLA